MRAAVLHTPGSPPSYGEHPAPAAVPGIDAGAGDGRARRAARPAVRERHVVLRGAGDAVRAGRSGRRASWSRRTRYAAGSRVWFFATAGMTARRRQHGRALPGAGRTTSSRIDDEVPDALAAALGLSGVAAWMALSWRARLQHGERVLVLGGGGAVGQAGIGAARVLGASTVVAVARPASVDRASAAGADVVVPLDPRRRRPQRSCSRSTARSTSCSTRSSGAATAAARVLAPGGRLVNLGGACGRRGDLLVGRTAQPYARRCSATRTTRSAQGSGPRRSGPSSPHAAAGRIRMQYAECPLADVEDVWRREMAGRPGARCVLLPGAQTAG